MSLMGTSRRRPPDGPTRRHSDAGSDLPTRMRDGASDPAPQAPELQRVARRLGGRQSRNTVPGLVDQEMAQQEADSRRRREQTQCHPDPAPPCRCRLRGRRLRHRPGDAARESRRPMRPRNATPVRPAGLLDRIDLRGATVEPVRTRSLQGVLNGCRILAPEVVGTRGCSESRCSLNRCIGRGPEGN